MFAVVKFLEEPTKLLDKIKFKMSPPKPVLSRINLKNSAPFYYLEIYRSLCGNEGEYIRQILGRCADSVIYCEKTLALNFKSVKKFLPKFLNKILLFNTALNYIKSKNIKFDSICIVDKDGIFTDRIFELIELANSIYIVTNFQGKYKKLVEDIYNKYGAYIIVDDKFGNFNNFDVVISPYENFNRFLNYSFIIKESDTFNVYRCSGVTLPENIKSIMPGGVEPILFASALYELCGCKQLSKLNYDKIEKVYDFK